MFFSKRNRRSRSESASTIGARRAPSGHAVDRSKRAKRRSFALERLEERTLLAVFTDGLVNWSEQGSQPITEETDTEPDGPSSGAVEDIAIDPNDPSHMFAATVNGGIWRTHDGNRPFNGVDDGGIGLFVDDPLEQPSWTPLTDQFPSLAMGGIAFDPTDASGNTVFAGSGSASSKGNDGGAPIGVFKTTDDGASWTVVELEPAAAEPQVRVVLPTTYTAADNAAVTQVVLVGTVGNGLYRSIDAGASYSQISNTGVGLPAGSVTDLTVDPNDDDVYYAGVVGSGVFRSGNGGQTWTPVNNATLSTNASLGVSTAVMLAAHPGGGTTRIYAMISYDDDGMGSPEVPQVFTSTNAGTSWTELAAVTSGFESRFGDLYTSRASDQIIVDPSDQTIVYISKGYGGSPFILRYDPSGAGSWDQIESVGAVGNSAPHVDNRDLQFVNSGGDDVLVNANDGGLYFLVDPQNPDEWTGMHGLGSTGLGITEYTNVTLDAVHDVLFGGAQDNGTSVQRSTGDVVWELFRGADGGDAQAADAGGGNSYRYSATQPGTANPNQSPISRHEFSSATGEVSETNLFPAGGLAGFTPRFVATLELNRFNSSRLVAGGGGASPVYELLNADTATGPGDAMWVNVPAPAGAVANDNDDAAYVVGGRLGGVDNEEVLILGSNNDVLIRSTAGGSLVATPVQFPGGTVQAIAVDPENWQHIFVADSDQVWETTNAGMGWDEITRNLGLINNRLQSLSYVASPDGDVILVGGNLGVSRLTVGDPADLWTRLGTNLPNAEVNDLEYHPSDDLLIAGTYGRGAWIVESASLVVNQEAVVTVCGDDDHVNQDDEFIVTRNSANPLVLEIFLNGTLVFSEFIASIDQINIFGIGGNDNLRVDSTNGLINVPDGIRYDGDGLCPEGFFGGEGFGFDRGIDRLTLEQTDGPTHLSDSLDVGATVGTGVSTIVGASGTPGDVQTVFFEELEPIVDGVPAASLTIDGGTVGTLMNEDNAINYECSDLPGLCPTWGKVTIDAFEPIHFTNKTTLIIDAENGSDEINLANPNTPTGLTGDCDAGAAGTTPICIFGDDPGGSDTLVITGTTAAETFEYAPADGSDEGTLVIPGADVAFTTIEAVEIDGASTVNDDTLIVRTEGGADRVVLEPGSNNDSGTFHVFADALTESTPDLSFRALGQDSFIQLLSGPGAGLREDTFEYLGTNTRDFFGVGTADGGTITLQVGSGGVNNRKPVRAPGVSTLILQGLDDDDDFSVPGIHPFTDGVIVNGGDPTSSDFLFVNGGGVTVTVDLSDSTITSTGFGPITVTGLEQVDISTFSASLTIDGTIEHDTIDFTPTSASEGSFRADPVFRDAFGASVLVASPLFNYNLGAAPSAIVVNGGGGGFDEIGIIAGPGNDLIDVSQTTASNLGVTLTLAPAVAAFTQNFTLTSIEAARIEALEGDDVIRVTVADALVATPASSLRFTVDGGEPNASDRLNVVDDGLGDTDIFREGNDDRSGSITIGPLAPVVFENVEFAYVTPLDDQTGGTGADNLGRFVFFKHDPYENNNSRFVATHLGAGEVINVDPTIDPGTGPLGVPADVDWYRVETEVSGTLDFQVFFNQVGALANGRAGLPGNGDLSIAVFDSTGDAIAGFGVNDATSDERIRIPAVQGQIYFLRVSGATGTAVNNYTMTIINAAPPVPFDLELDDLPVLPPSPSDVCPAIIGGGASNNSDTGRSQFDNVTCDSTPTIRFRLNDGIFLHDLPGNAANDTPPDEVIPILKTDQDAVAAGYRVAIFEEGQPQQGGGALPQVPIGFATRIFEGVYEFTFPTALTEGSHFIWARVQMVDPATPQQTGFGDNSQSLEIVVDTIDPPVSFGDSSTVNDDGLAASSDTGVVGQPATFTDNVTSDTTPTFWGTAEANSVIRVFADTAGGATIQICETVTVPNDGTNQFPNGEWTCTSNVDLNDPQIGFAFDGLRLISVQAEDLAGNISSPIRIEIFLDTRGPQVTSVLFDPIDPALPEESVFGIKPLQANAPTPLTRTIVINARDLPPRAVGAGAVPGGPFLYGALNSIVAVTPGQYVLTGDQNGVIAISSIIVINNPTADASIATARIELNFNTPLPDDRYTLTVNDDIVDDVGNALDGQSNSQEPLDNPTFPTGDGQPGGDYIARFTVDSRPEVGAFCCASWYIDLNQNGQFDDPNNHDTDFTNGDIVYKFGLPGDFPVVGDWDGNGFDEVGVYGRRADGFRFELDLNGNGAFDTGDASFLFGTGGRPIAGAWNPGQGPDDHVAVFTGTRWLVDFTAAAYTPASSPPATTIITAARGRPIAADFNGDGDDDAGLFQNNVFRLDVASDDDFLVDTNITFGFSDALQLPVAGDWDADRDGNIGLWVPNRNGVPPREASEFYLDLGRPFTGPLSGPISAIFGGPGASPANAGDGLFQPPPTGGLPTMPNLPYVFQDIFYQFGDELAEPVIGNFDPPHGDAPVDIIERPDVRLDDANSVAAGATPVFVWESGGEASESAAIESGTDRDVFQIQALESGIVAIVAQKDGSSVDTYLTVYNSAGRRLARNANIRGSTDSRVEINVTEGETYYIAVTSTRRTTGSYEMLVDYLLVNDGGASEGDDHGNTKAAATVIAPNSGSARVAGRIDANDLDFFKITPTTSGRLDISARSLGGGLDTGLTLYDSAGQIVAQNNNSGSDMTDSSVRFDVVANETYFIRVRGQKATVGEYELTVDSVLGGGL